MNARAEAAADFTPGAGYQRSGEDYVRTADFRVLDILARLALYKKQLYCYPSLQTIRELVFKFTGRSISERSLCRHLGALERDGWIGRQRRHETNRHTGELVLHSTLYLLTKRTVKWCRSVSSNVWNWSTATAKSLIDMALPVLAETLARENRSNTQRRRKPPPKR